jgi:SAM-dependent methyltransferase
MPSKTQSRFAFLFSKHPDYYWKQMLAYMSLLVVVVFIGGQFLENTVIRKEGFEQQKEFVLQTQETSYDAFYAEIYDQIHPVSSDSIKRIIRYIERETQPSKEQSMFLEVGCGTGKCLYQLQENGYQVSGIDQSIAMIEEAKEMCGTQTHFETKNVLASSLTFEDETFSHILCLGPTTLYEICSPNSSFLRQEASATSHANLEKFIGHVKRWLKRGGYLVLQIEPLTTLPQSWISITGGKPSFSPAFPKRISHPDPYSTEIRFSKVDYSLEMTPSVPNFASTNSKGSFLGTDENTVKQSSKSEYHADDQHHLQPLDKPSSKIVIEKPGKKTATETVVLKETFANRNHSHVRQNEWHLTSPFSDTQDWVQAIQQHGFLLTKAAAIPYPSAPMSSTATHAPVPQIYLFQKI